MTGLMVGRGVEAAVLRRLIAELPRASAAVLVHGEAGIGKTMLVESVLTDSPAGGQRVLRGACAPMAGAAAYSGLDVALGGVLSEEVRAEGTVSSAAGRARALELLRSVLSEGPAAGTILVVEDVHWADWSTLDFLAYTTRNLPTNRLLVLLTWRDDENDADRLTWLAEQLRNPSLTDIPLRGLSLAQSAEQLRELTPDCTPAIVESVHRRSAGNPYLNAELAAAPSDVSMSLRQVLHARLNRVSPLVREIVASTATLARPLTDDELLAVASDDVAAVRLGWESGLLVRDPAGSTSRHPVVAEVAYENLLPPERQQLHARLAAYLAAALGPAASASAVAEVAEQYRRSGDRAATLRWSVAAARAAESRFALAEAGHWYAVAFSCRDANVDEHDVPDQRTLAESAAALLGGAGHHRAAITVLDQALAGRDDDAELVPALLSRSWLRMHVGATEDALDDVERALRLVPPGDDLLRARALVRHGLVLLSYSHEFEASEPAAIALELALRLGDTRTVGQSKTVLGFVDANARRFDIALDELRAAMAIARQVAEPDDIALAGLGLSYVYGEQFRVDALLDTLHLTQQELRRLMTSRHWLEDMIESNVVLMLYLLGRWDEALTYERVAADPDLPILEGPLAQIHLARGELATASEMQHRSRAFDRDDQPMWKLGYAEVQVALCIQQGRLAEALDIAIATADVVHGTGEEQQARELLLAGLEAAVAQGAFDEFERLVAQLRGAVVGMTSGAVTATIDAERARLHGRPQPELWLAAAEEWAAIQHPYPEARARLRAAEALLGLARVAGSRGRAARELEAARRTAESLAAAPLLEQIKELAKLARISLDDAAAESHQPAVQEEWPDLTERERQVLALLAAGRTNSQIGAALFMSPKTASVHVTHILQKLGVQTRVQAAAMAVRLGLDS
jgi:DNA-binding CsgD family transcriptional regulator/tetratricopeptide (TPR) repeat protein